MAPPLIGGLASRADNGLNLRSGHGLRLEESLPGSIASVLTSLVTTSVVFHFFGGFDRIEGRLKKLWLRLVTGQRYQQISQWRNVSYTDCLILALFIDSWLFSATSSMLQFGGFDLNTDAHACKAASYVCVLGYFISKWVIRGCGRGRLKSKLYLFNLAAVLVCYVAWLPVYVVFHISHDNSGICIIGIRQQFLAAAFACDIVINLWLTGWFLYPLIKLKPAGTNRIKAIACPRRAGQDTDHSVKRLYNLARRTFLGSIIALTSTSLNLGLSIAYDGQAAWLCLMLCRIDAFICAAVVNWITQKEPAAPNSQDKPWGVPKSRGTGFTTLVGNPSIPGHPHVRSFEGVGGDAHPGSLVPGSLHLGRYGNSGEDLQQSSMSIKSAPESNNAYTRESEEMSVHEDR
ncbi:hypothetical protein N8I77_002497 [Diaporthe amygdali]|uniref:Transmembrane protein n=1 Tax=Phomopsis amygdali TaxID=1214568 RepID=A0AAD9WBV4_PHOAM|nr:hypothetical protein N8I77_002497 [Diaporthe amygdali]